MSCLDNKFYDAQGHIVEKNLHQKFADEFSSFLSYHTERTQLPRYRECQGTLQCCNPLKTDIVSEKFTFIDYFNKSVVCPLKQNFRV